MKLIAFVAREGLALPGLRASAMSTFEIGKNAMADWKVHLRGPALLLESPPGFNGAGADVRTVYEIPRSVVNLKWTLEAGDKIADLASYTHPDPPKQKAPPASASIMPAVAEARAAIAAAGVTVDSKAMIATDRDDDIEEDDGDGDSLPVTRGKRPH